MQLSLQTTAERHSPCPTLQDLAAVLGLRGRGGARDIPGDGRLGFWGIFGAFPPSKPGTPGQEADLPGGHPIAEMLLERAENREKKENLFTWPQVDTAFPCRSEGSRLPKFPSSAAPLPRPWEEFECSSSGAASLSRATPAKNASPFPQLPPDPL